MRRFGKQLAYGLLFITFWGTVGTGAYFLWLKPAPTCFDEKQNQDEVEIDCGGGCIKCELKGLELEESSVTKIPVGERQTTFLAEVRNPSSIYGATFRYELSVRSAFGGDINVIQGESSVRPGETRPVVIAGFAVDSRDVGEVTLEVTKFDWDLDRALFSYEIRVENATTLLEENRIKVSGSLSNDGSSFVSRTRITGIVLDREGEILNASIVEIRDLDAFGSKNFTLFFPEIEDVETRLDATKTQLFWEIIGF